MGDQEPGKAIPFVALEDGKFNLTQGATDFLSTIDYPVSVIAVVGLYRTGKSFLMNRILLEDSRGFQVGPTVNPCTKGLWVWDKVLTGVNKEGETVKYIVVDTEGIGALDTNSQHDSIIFSLALLLSSFFIYNSVGSIDEGALNNLSLVVNLTKHIHVRSSAQGGEDDGADFAQYFPSFLWLVRDFTLQLVTPDGQAFTSKEYLERALQPAPGFTEQIEAKNRIRRMLTHFFPERDCFTMVRPVTDESLLQKLDGIPASKLRPEFQEQMGLLRKLILSKCEPKRMNGTALDGVALVNLAQAYTQSINTGSVPSIQNAWSYICESKCQHALNEALKKYEAEAKTLREESLPLGVDELDEINKELIAEAWVMFKKHAIGTDTDSFQQQLEDKMSTIYRQLQADNAAMGREKAKETLEKLYAELDMKVQEEAFATFDEYETERRKVRSSYNNDVPAGPFKLEVLASFMETKLADVGSRFQSRSAMEIQKTKAAAKAAVDEAQRELLTAKMEAEKEMGSIKLKLEYAEKYNEEAKQREKDNREEMSKLRATHEAAIKEVREKAENELKTQVSALEEKRNKAQQEAQQAEQALLQLKKDQEKQHALLEQEKDFATKSAADAAAREVELRKLLESARRDAEADIKNVSDKLEAERAATSATIAQLTEEIEKSSEAAAEWKNKHAALGVQLTSQLKALQDEVESKAKELAEASEKLVELEAEGGKKAKAEKEILAGELEALQAQYEHVCAQRQDLANAQTVAAEDATRLTSQLDEVRRQLKKSEEESKEARTALQTLEDQKKELEENDQSKADQVSHLNKALEQATQSQAKTEKELSAALTTTKEQLESVQKQAAAQVVELEKKSSELAAQLVEASTAVNKLNDEVEALQAQLKAAEENQQQGITITEEQWKSKLSDMESKLRKKLADVNAAAERTQMEMKHGFQNEKEAMEARIRSLEKQAAEDKEQAENEIREYESAMDELEQNLKAEADARDKEYAKEKTEMEKSHMKIQSELQQKMEGQASRISMLEQQLSELRTQYKEERAETEQKYAADLKNQKMDTEQRISKMEQDLSASTSKYEMLLGDFRKAEENHSAKMEDMNSRHALALEKSERERKELQKEKDEAHSHLMAENDKLSAKLKQLENDHIMTTKDRETEKALMERQLKQLEKMLEEREAVCRNLEQSKEAEIGEMRSKLQNTKSDDEVKMQREREEAKAKFEELKNRTDEKMRTLKEQLNAKQTELKVLEERIDGYKASEAKAQSAIADYKTRMGDQKEAFSAQIKELKENLQTALKELQEERSEHQMMKLRAEKQEEWDKREMSQLKEEVAEKKKLMDGMISKEIYKRDMDAHKSQHQSVLGELHREKESEKTRLEGDKKRLEDELNKAMSQLKKLTSEGVMSEAKQKEMERNRAEKERFGKELEEARRELETLRKATKVKEDELKKRENDLGSAKEQLKPLQSEREELKRERDELETKVMKLEMELKNIQQIEERKYQVEIMRLKTENEELKRADKKKQMIEPKTPSGDALDTAQPALTSALARVRARRTTAQGSAAK